MDRRSLLETARGSRGLTQEAVARRSGTSQPTLSAYERGTKSPTLAVVERILHTLGYDLGLQPRVTFREVLAGGRTCHVPDQLWRLDPPDCFVPVRVSDADGTRRTLNLLDRESRVEAYVWLLKNGDETQLFTHIDGALLVANLQARLPRPVSRRARARAIKRLAERGLTVDEIRAVLRRR